MTNMLHEVKTRQPWIEPRSADLEPVLVALDGAVLDDASSDRRVTWSAPRQYLIGGILFLASMAVSALVLQWATTYQGHRAWFSPASLSLVIGFVVIAGSLELAATISHRRSVEAGHGQRGTADAGPTAE